MSEDLISARWDNSPKIDQTIRVMGSGGHAWLRKDLEPPVLQRIVLGAVLLLAHLMSTALAIPSPLPGDEAPPSPGFVTELAASEADVLLAVKSVAEDSIVRGTYVYERDQTLKGAVPGESSAYFGRWQGSGHVFYKVLPGAVSPRHFKESTDIGTITVRYVVQAVNEARTRLRIDAVFAEAGQRKAHVSDGSVETSEFKEIQERLRQIQLFEQEAAEAQKNRQKEDAKRAILLHDREDEAARLASAESSIRDLEQRLRELQHNLELRVKNEGAQLKTAPFRSAMTLQSLNSGTEVIVLIVTPYWYGVETQDGHRGWLHHDQVEPLR